MIHDMPDRTNQLPPRERPEKRGRYDVALDAALKAELDRLDALKMQLDQLKEKHPELWPAVLHKLKVRWTTDSNAIEGSTLTFAETLFFLEQGLTVKGKPFKDHLDARNHAEAIEMLFDAVAQQRPISEGLLKELNALIMLGVTHMPARDRFGRMQQKPVTSGQYKQQPNHVVQADGTIHHYVEPVHVGSEMQELCSWIETAGASQHPAITAALAHYNYVRIHPFDDGNGRGARILMNLVLMRAGFPPIVQSATLRQDYIAALNLADNGDLRPFVDFLLAQAQASIEAMIEDFRQAP